MQEIFHRDPQQRNPVFEEIYFPPRIEILRCLQSFKERLQIQIAVKVQPVRQILYPFYPAD